MARAEEELLLRIRADTAQALSGIGDLSSVIKRFSDIIKFAATPVGALAIGFTTVALSAQMAAGAFLDEAKSVKELAFQTGLSVEKADALADALQLAGVPVESMRVAMFRMAAEIESGGSKLHDLGISLRDNAGNLKSQGDLFLEVRDKISGMSNAQERNTALVKIFGRGAGELIAIFEKSREEFAALTAAGERLGFSMTKEGIEKAKAFTLALNTLKFQAKESLIAYGSIVIETLQTTLVWWEKAIAAVGRYIGLVGGPTIELEKTRLQIYIDNLTFLQAQERDDTKRQTITIARLRELEAEAAKRTKKAMEGVVKQREAKEAEDKKGKKSEETFLTDLDKFKRSVDIEYLKSKKQVFEAEIAEAAKSRDEQLNQARILYGTKVGMEAQYQAEIARINEIYDAKVDAANVKKMVNRVKQMEALATLEEADRLATIIEHGRMIDGLKLGYREYLEAAETAAAYSARAFKEMADSIKGSLSDAVVESIKHIDNLQDASNRAWQAIGDAFLKKVIDRIVSEMVDWAIDAAIWTAKGIRDGTIFGTAFASAATPIIAATTTGATTAGAGAAGAGAGAGAGVPGVLAVAAGAALVAGARGVAQEHGREAGLAALVAPQVVLPVAALIKIAKDPVKVVEDVGRSVASFFGFAKGGIVTRPTLAMIGEAGPEAVIPLNGRGNGMGFSPTIHVGPIQIMDASPAQARRLAEVVGDALMARLRNFQRI